VTTVRTCTRLVLVGLAALALLVTPTLGSSIGDPAEADLGEIAVDDWQRDGDWLVSSTLDARTTVLVGARWHADGATVEMRAADAGIWGRWVAFHDDHEHAPDAHGDHAHDDADEVTTDPIWIGAADTIQIRIRGGESATVVLLETVEMSGGDGAPYVAAPDRRGSAIATGLPPSAPQEIVPRSSWDPAGECGSSDDPEISESGFRLAHVHHTVMYPRYGPDEAPDVVRALCLFHTEARGWSDLGYNFLVDRYGRIYEGRAGSLERPIVGAHAAGFNHVSLGVTAIGDFETDEVPPEAVEAIERLIAWKFSVYEIDPRAAVVVESTGGDNPALSRYASGEAVALPAIVGHRDTGSDTLCPGRFLYAAMDGIDARVTDLMVAAGHDIDAFAEPDEPAEDVSTTSSSAPGEPESGTSAAGDAPVIAAAIGDQPQPLLPVTGLGLAAGALLSLAIAAGLAAFRPQLPAEPITSEEGRRRRRAPSAGQRRRRRSG
jgi:hypothetical protein